MDTRGSPATAQSVSFPAIAFQRAFQLETSPAKSQRTERAAPDQQTQTLPILHKGFSFYMGQITIAGEVEEEDGHEESE